MEKVAEELTPGRGEAVNENILNKVVKLDQMIAKLANRFNFMIEIERWCLIWWSPLEELVRLAKGFSKSEKANSQF